MRDVFRAYYRPTDEQFAALWKNCLFVLDANVLLNLYRYSAETRKALIDILRALSDRLWVPYQAALEYHRRRLTVIERNKTAYDALCSFLDATQDGVERKFREYARHPSIKADQLLKVFNGAIKKATKTLNELKKAHPELQDRDEIRDDIARLLTGKVGPQYSRDRLTEIYKEGKTRYEESIPPGYSDRDKKDPHQHQSQYGDLVLWFQVIVKANETSKPIILVTDDRKEDWWLRVSGKTIGPRPELVDEIFAKANVSFYMYSADSFIEQAAKYLERSVKHVAISEVRKIRESEEGLLAGLPGYLSVHNLYDFPSRLLMEEQHARLLEAIKESSTSTAVQRMMEEEAKRLEELYPSPTRQLMQDRGARLREAIMGSSASTVVQRMMEEEAKRLEELYGSPTRQLMEEQDRHARLLEALKESSASTAAQRIAEEEAKRIEERYGSTDPSTQR